MPPTSCTTTTRRCTTGLCWNGWRSTKAVSTPISTSVEHCSAQAVVIDCPILISCSGSGYCPGAVGVCCIEDYVVLRDQRPHLYARPNRCDSNRLYHQRARFVHYHTGVRLLFRGTADLTCGPHEGVEVDIGYSFFQGDDAVVGQVDMLRANLRAALGDVAEAYARLLAYPLAAVETVIGVHIEVGKLDKLARAIESVLAVVLAQDMTHILAEEALDALAELLYAVHIYLLHLEWPGRVCGRSKWSYLRRHPEVPRHIGHQVFYQRESLQRVDEDGSVAVRIIPPTGLA